MSIFQTDLYLHSFLRVALADIKSKSYLADDMMKDLLTDPYLKKLYGQKEIDNLKEFFKREIYIMLDHKGTEDTAKFPCVSINIGGGSEDQGKDTLGDALTEDVDWEAKQLGNNVPSSCLIKDITPIDYNEVTGQVTFSESVDLTHVYEGYTINGVSGIYPILIVDGENGILYIEPIPTNKLDLTNAFIMNPKDVYKASSRTISFWENSTLTCWSTNTTELLYLWTIILYACMRYKQQLIEARGYDLITLSYTGINLTQPEDPNNIYNRSISIKGRVTHSAIDQVSGTIKAVDVSTEMCGSILETRTQDELVEEIRKVGWIASNCKSCGVVITGKTGCDCTSK